MRVWVNVVVIVFLSNGFLQAQYIGEGSGKGTQMGVHPGSIVEQMSLPEPKTEGNSYLYEDWLIGTIVTTNEKTISGLPIRYDLNNNGLEIRAYDQVKFLEGSRINKFSLTTGTGEVIRYVNFRPFVKLNPDIANVFLELIENGEWSLYRQISTSIIKGNYNAALDMGTRNNRIVKKTSYIIASNSKAFLVDKSKRRFSKKFAKEADVLSFIKEHGLKLNNEQHLKELVGFLNTDY